MDQQAIQHHHRHHLLNHLIHHHHQRDDEDNEEEASTTIMNLDIKVKQDILDLGLGRHLVIGHDHITTDQDEQDHHHQDIHVDTEINVLQVNVYVEIADRMFVYFNSYFFGYIILIILNKRMLNNLLRLLTSLTFLTDNVFVFVTNTLTFVWFR